jgi:cytidine deaminase
MALKQVEAGRLAALRRVAEAARSTNYAPYSNFLVLAAVEAQDGNMYGGSNVENANFSLSKHAEEVAILAAIGAGQGPERPWLKTLYVAGGSPCGSCRQFTSEFAADDAICVIEQIGQPAISRPGALTDSTAEVDIWDMNALLPASFGPADVLGQR